MEDERYNFLRKWRSWAVLSADDLCIRRLSPKYISRWIYSGREWIFSQECRVRNTDPRILRKVRSCPTCVIRHSWAPPVNRPRVRENCVIPAIFVKGSAASHFSRCRKLNIKYGKWETLCSCCYNSRLYTRCTVLNTFSKKDFAEFPQNETRSEIKRDYFNGAKSLKRIMLHRLSVLTLRYTLRLRVLFMRSRHNYFFHDFAEYR